MSTKHPAAVLALGFVVAVSGGYIAESASGAEPAKIALAAENARPFEAPVEALTDPQIAHIAVTANAIDVEIARLVRPRTTKARVRGFAETMITDHTAVNEQAASLAARLGVTPEDNPVSQSLRAGADEASENLRRLNSSAFDAAYLEREVAYHQAVLDALDETLIPGAQNQELRGLLQAVRPAIVAHLDHAVALQGALEER